MKCPKRYTIVQQNMSGYLYNQNGQTRIYNQMFIETQEFGECYEEECTAWDSEKKICRKVGDE